MKGKSDKTPTAAQPHTKLDGMPSVFSILTTKRSAAAPTDELDDRTKRGAARIRRGGGGGVVNEHTPVQAEELIMRAWHCAWPLASRFASVNERGLQHERPHHVI